MTATHDFNFDWMKSCGFGEFSIDAIWLCNRLYAEDCQNGIHDTHQAFTGDQTRSQREVEFLLRLDYGASR